jgi:DNA-binding NtrC family response regulator
LSRVLLVDDDPLQLQIREAVLRGAGFEVTVATAAGVALAAVRAEMGRNRLGLVITDHLMPDMTGAEFVRELRKLTPALPVIVMSGLPEAVSEYKDLDVTFRQKPCPPVELIALVSQLIGPAHDSRSA